MTDQLSETEAAKAAQEAEAATSPEAPEAPEAPAGVEPADVEAGPAPQAPDEPATTSDGDDDASADHTDVVEARGSKLEEAHALAEAPLVDPAGNAGLLEVFNRRYLLTLMVKRELRARYIGSKMGLAWSYINPLSRFLTFYFVFGIIMNRGAIPHFAIHLFAGMVIVNYFNETFNSGTRAIMQNKAVVNKLPLPRQMFPVASMLVSLYHIGPQLVVLVVVCFGTGVWQPDLPGVIAMVMAFAIVIPLATGMGVMFSAINVLYRDFTRVVQILTNMLPFTVPMMYSYNMVSTRFGTGIWYRLYFDNPIAIAVMLMQRCFWYTTVRPADGRSGVYNFQYGTAANFPAHLYTRGLTMILVSVVFVFIAQAVFNRLDDRLPDRLSG